MALNKKIENLVLQIDPKNNLIQILRSFGDSQKDVVIEKLSCEKELFENKRIFEALDSVLSVYLAESPISSQSEVFFVLADTFVSTDVIALPIMPTAKLKTALNAELNKAYPHLETMHISTTVLQKNKKRVVFGVTMISKTTIQDCVLVAKKYGLNLKNISFSSNAVVSGALQLATKLKQDSFLFLNIKETESAITYVVNQKVVCVHTLPFGQNALTDKTAQFLPNFIDSSLAEKEVFATTHLTVGEEPTFFAGTMDEIEARSFQNFQKNKKQERLVAEKFLSTFSTHKNILQKNFSMFLRHINAVKSIFEHYGLPQPELVVVNLPQNMLDAIQHSGLDVPVESLQSLMAQPNLLAEFLDLFGMIYVNKFNPGQNMLS